MFLHNPLIDPSYISFAVVAVPFQIEFNPLEPLYGVEKMYLRNHFLDSTFLRDWSMNRMLARFGLPHLRTRKLRFYINGDYIGFYDAVEAIEQEYVFARSFPEYNPFNYSLYKKKIEAVGCGQYDPDLLADAASRLEDPSKPPYSFERGTHRDAVPVYGKLRLPRCLIEFANKFFIEDVRFSISVTGRASFCFFFLLTL
jgi:CotH kinase protein